MTAYYNELDPYCCDWLENLIRDGLIAPGVVDRRDIRDVLPRDLAAFDQCHFFAGLGGWSHALRLAAWPDHRQVWTGSCPCQPFSQAGARRGFADERHLWPFWHHLIGVRRPPVVFGEQVAHGGLPWLDLVLSDLEHEGYACGAAVLPAAGVGAPHGRHRLWFVADLDGSELRQQPRWRDGADRQGAAFARAPAADFDGGGLPVAGREGAVGKAAGIGASGPRGEAVADPDGARLANRRQQVVLEQRAPIVGGGWWAVEPDVGRMVDGFPGRMDQIRALGNAIVPQIAAEFIRACMSLDAPTTP